MSIVLEWLKSFKIDKYLILDVLRHTLRVVFVSFFRFALLDTCDSDGHLYVKSKLKPLGSFIVVLCFGLSWTGSTRHLTANWQAFVYAWLPCDLRSESLNLFLFLLSNDWKGDTSWSEIKTVCTELLSLFLNNIMRISAEADGSRVGCTLLNAIKDAVEY